MAAWVDFPAQTVPYNTLSNVLPISVSAISFTSNIVTLNNLIDTQLPASNYTVVSNVIPLTTILTAVIGNPINANSVVIPRTADFSNVPKGQPITPIVVVPLNCFDAPAFQYWG